MTRAPVGSAWCRLCQDSPNEAIARNATLRDLSRTSNDSWPNVWQIELMDHVTWCSAATRTSVAQKNAVTAPGQDIDHRPPIAAGSSSETATILGNDKEMRRISRSASRSGQNRCFDVLLGLNIQPMWA